MNKATTLKRPAEEELEKYARELEESNRLKDLFIDIMRHDLLNPAGIAKTMAELSLREEEDPQKRDALQLILDTNKRIIEMIENASTLATLESGEELEVEEIDLGITLRSAAKEMTPLAEKKNIKIKITSNGEFKTLANPLIESCFINLLSNAIKYGPKNSEVSVGIKENHSEWKISVADNGPGIPDEDKEAIFDRFKRIEKGAVKGTGLGLAIVKKVINVHGGRVWVEDNPGGGSIFYVSLPKKT